MKALVTLLIGLSLCPVLYAKKPAPIPKNASRLAVDAYVNSIYKIVGNPSKQKPETELPKFLLNLGKDWTPQYQVDKNDKAMIVRYIPQGEKYLEHGSGSVFITTNPFNIKLTEAPNVQDNAAALEFEVQRWLPQKWQTYKIPVFKNFKVRGYMEMQSGGADNAAYATEPFAVKSKSGKTYWLIVTVNTGFHKTKGMTLQRALNALVSQ